MSTSQTTTPWTPPSVGPQEASVGRLAELAGMIAAAHARSAEVQRSAEAARAKLIGGTTAPVEPNRTPETEMYECWADEQIYQMGAMLCRLNAVAHDISQILDSL
jgi:hypothetical protein